MSEPDMKQLLTEGFKVDPQTHPIYLQEFEWALFEKMENARSPLMHRHKWTYRRSRALGEVYIVGENEVTATHLSPARYCAECKRIEYVTEATAMRHTMDRWTQLDMIALGLR
jgi:hypothetical protein